VLDRSFFDPRLGVDLSAVSNHDDDRAANSARSIDARAYILGSHVAFASRMDASSNSGRRLLAPVAQQGAAQDSQLTQNRQTVFRASMVLETWFALKATVDGVTCPRWRLHGHVEPFQLSMSA
jgi:hypothetical protein